MKTNITRLGLIVTLALPLCALSFAGCAGDRYSRSTGEYIDDKAMNMRVKSALGDNPEYKFSEVTVTSFKGTVQLGGFVQSSDQKAKAGDIAKSVQGVQNVENKITVKQ